jgi:hypothetical protein
MRNAAELEAFRETIRRLNIGSDGMQRIESRTQIGDKKYESRI